LNGTRLGCISRIEIGDDCILADARIIDTDFHSVGRLRNTEGAAPPASAPIRISKNVWISANAAVLKGVEIGENSVIGFGSVVVSAVPADRIFAGNPAKDAGAVP
jgi:maltose O-acetyltransferase